LTTFQQVLFSFRSTVYAKMMKLTMIALIFACVVGGVSAGCIGRSPCGGVIGARAYGIAPAVRTVAVAPAVRRVAVAPVVRRVAVVRVAPPKWTPFSAWGPCSVHCGTGVQSRTRGCYQGQQHSNLCVGHRRETRACLGRSCPRPVVKRVVVAAPVVRRVVAAAPVVRRVVAAAPVVRRVVAAAPVVRRVVAAAPVVRRVVAAAPVVRQVVAAAPAIDYVGGGVVGVAGGCGDLTGSCGAWGAAGFCASYPGYMRTNCCNSCTGLISAYIKDKISQVNWSEETYIRKMNEELENMKRK